MSRVSDELAPDVGRDRSGGSIVRSPTPGAPLFVDAWLRDTEGRPIAGAEVDIWHSSPEGLYENEDSKQAEMNLRGQFVTDDEGRFEQHFAFFQLINVGRIVIDTRAGDDVVRADPGFLLNGQEWGIKPGDFQRGAVALLEIHGGPGNNQLFGGAGPDTIVGGPGHDFIVGGGGGDRPRRP